MKKKCKICGEKFTASNTTQQVCSMRCAIELTNQQKERHKKEVRKIFKAKVLGSDRSHQLKLAQKAFNKFIRLRDENEPCISCQRHHKGQYHAGHYRTVGSMPSLRFNELNCHKQCSACNNHLSGNIVEYRINLERKIGTKNMAFLEQDHPAKKYTLDEIKEIKSLYLLKCREMELANVS